jgi:hypothetical protein
MTRVGNKLEPHLLGNQFTAQAYVGYNCGCVRERALEDPLPLTSGHWAAVIVAFDIEVMQLACILRDTSKSWTTQNLSLLTC